MPIRALLTFWAQPAEATRTLETSRAAWLAPLVPALALFCHLLTRGCKAPDAAASALALLLLVLGLGLGGGLATYPASFLTGATYRIRERVGPCLVFATWTAILFAAVVLFCRAVGVGAEAVLYTSIVLVVWGGAAGTALVMGPQTEDAGRALVGSCIGLAGALGGLWFALMLVHAQLVFVAPATIEVAGLEPGDTMLIRRVLAPPAGSIVLLQDGRETVLAKTGPKGVLIPLGNIAEATFRSHKWDVAGRVFFKFGGSWGGTVVLGGRSPP